MDEKAQIILVILAILIFALLVVIVALLITKENKEFTISQREKQKKHTLDEISKHTFTIRDYSIFNYELLEKIDKMLTDLTANKVSEDPTIVVLSKEQHDELHNINNIKLREKIIKLMQEGKTLGEAAKEVGVAFSFSAKDTNSEKNTNVDDFFKSVILAEAANE